MNYILRDYQNEAVAVGYRELQAKRNSIILCPSGSGKSLVIAGIARQLNAPTLILQPNREVLMQNYDKLTSYSVEGCTRYSASVGEKEIGNFTFATIGSIYKKPELFKHFEYVIFDELHLFNTAHKKGMYNKFFAGIGNPPMIGLTATPFRNVQRYRKEGNMLFYETWCRPINRIHPFTFKNIAFKIEHKDLLDQGYLCPIEYKLRDKTFDMRRLAINSTGADFTKDSLEAYMALPLNISRVTDSVQEFYDKSKHILIFCSSLSNIKTVQNALRDTYGYESEAITAETKKKDREDILERFRKGETKIVLNFGTLTVGVDIPELDCVILGRPTMSLNLYYQMLCRGVRLAEGKEYCTVVDCCNNVRRFGRVETLQMTKEPDGFKDRVETEMGVMSSAPLSKWVMKQKIYN